MNPPLVSSIIIFLNAERFIKEAIESVFSQTYENWELLLVDDGSTDDSADIAKAYAQTYPDKVRYYQHYNHINLGMSASRNVGINHARGEYITFLDADDIWLPYKLSQQVAIMESHQEAAMVYGRVLFWHSWNKNSGTVLRDYSMILGSPANTLIQPPQLVVSLLKDKVQTPNQSDFMARRAVFEEIGQFEEEFRGYGEDRVFHLKLLLKKPVFVSDECWSFYRQHENSCCANLRKKGLFLKANSTYFKWIEDYLTKQNMGETELLRLVRLERKRHSHPLLYYLTSPHQIVVFIGQRYFPKWLRHWLWVTFAAKVART